MSMLVTREVGRCPACGEPTEREVMTEEPLLRHGGYGAARRTVTEHCPALACSWFLLSEVAEDRPA